MRRTTSFLSPAILLDLWETRAGRALRAVGLDSVRTTIVTLAVLATLIPALATSYISYQQNRRAIQAKLNEQLAAISSQAAREMGLWLKERQYELKVFASSYEVTENLERGAGQSHRLPDYLQSVKERSRDYMELLAVTPDQRTVASSERQPGRLHLQGDWLQRSKVGDVVMGEPTRADSNAPATMEVAVPIVSSTGRFLGVMAGRLNLHNIQLQLGTLAENRDLRVTVVEPSGRVVATVGTTITNFPAGPLRHLTQAESTAVAYQGADDVAVMGAQATVPATDWIAIAEIPQETAFAEIHRMRNATALLMVVLLIVVGGLAYGLGLLIVRPVDRLARAANRVAEGDLNVVVEASSGGGELSRLTGVFNDMVKNLRESHNQLEKVSVTDALTGIANRRLLDLELERELRRSDRHGHVASVLMLDVDRFKTFNDTYGHQAGDAVLKRLANTIRECVRDVDLVARYGGEEFTVILPEAPAAEAARVAERIRAKVEADRFSPGDGTPEMSVTVSIGYAIFPENAKAPDTLIEAADAALYRSKAAGRNRVTGSERADKTKAKKQAGA